MQALDKPLDISLWDTSAQQIPTARLQTDNTQKGHQALTHWLTAHQAVPQQTIIVMENTAVYGDHLIAHLSQHHWKVAVEKTTILSKVRPAHHRKEDRFDADLLAEYGYRFRDQLTVYHPINPVIQQIRLLYRERRRLVDQRASIKQLMREAKYRTADIEFARQLWVEQIQFYTQAIEAIEQKLQQLISTDQQIAHRYQLITNNIINKLIRIITAVSNSQARYNPDHVSRFAPA